MRFSTIIASVLGIGYFPVASGTVMSIVATILATRTAAVASPIPGIVTTWT